MKLEKENKIYFEKQELELNDGRKLEIVPNYVAEITYGDQRQRYSSHSDSSTLEDLLDSLRDQKDFDEISFNLENHLIFEGGTYGLTIPYIHPRSISLSERYLVGKEISFEDLLKKISNKESDFSLNTLGHIVKHDKKLIFTNSGLVRGFSYLQDTMKPEENPDKYKLVKDFKELREEFEKGNIGKEYWERNKK
jgi:hypothetical protein